MVLRRPGSRRQGQGGARFEGNRRIGALHGAVLEGRARRGRLAWDDSNNNRAFLSGDISASLNGASIYVAALNGKDKFKTEKGAPLHTDILHAPLPAGPKGQHGYHTAFNHMVMKYSKNAKGAIEFLRWAHKKENYEKWFTVKGFAVGPTREWEKHAMWKQDPVMKPFQTAPRLQKRLMGYRPARQERRRGLEQVHRHRDARSVQRQDEARGSGEVGRGRARQDLHRS